MTKRSLLRLWKLTHGDLWVLCPKELKSMQDLEAMHCQVDKNKELRWLEHSSKTRRCWSSMKLRAHWTRKMRQKWTKRLLKWDRNSVKLPQSWLHTGLRLFKILTVLLSWKKARLLKMEIIKPYWGITRVAYMLDWSLSNRMLRVMNRQIVPLRLIKK